MKHLTKLLSLVLALALCLGLAVPAFAASKPEFEITGTTLKKYNGSGSNVTIPSGITAIANNAFKGCDTVVSVTIPEGVTSIGNSAFNKCESLQSVTIPGSVTSVGTNAFSNCTSLIRANILGAANVSSNAFSGCSSLTTAAFYNSKARIGEHVFTSCTSLTTVYLPNELSALDTGLFDGCKSLTTLYLPASVTTVDTWVFSGANVADVYYEGTEDQWENVSIGHYNGDFKSANVHCNSKMPVPPPVFTDVPDNQFYTEPVSWAVSKDITTGTGNGAFSPTQICTQAQILTFLYRGTRSTDESAPAASAADMDAAISWAKAMGMIDDSFVGSKPCTRATAVSYIWQAFGSPSASGGTFSDIPAGADYTVSVSWAVQQGITSGTGGGNFSPDDICNRGQIVTFLYRAYVK